MYNDDEVRMLPDIDPLHLHYKEWLIRKKSSTRLYNYLLAKNKPLDIFEAGCGNGWLSHRLSAIPGSTITASDLNLAELQQAARVFSDIANIKFVFGDSRTTMVGNNRYDVIIFAASIQYFSSLPDILNIALSQLTEGGEIHIVDSHFYTAAAMAVAKSRRQITIVNWDFLKWHIIIFIILFRDLNSFLIVFCMILHLSGIAFYWANIHFPGYV
jgi:protein-L-isoaspartate O-methyltransferase